MRRFTLNEKYSCWIFRNARRLENMGSMKNFKIQKWKTIFQLSKKYMNICFIFVNLVNHQLPRSHIFLYLNILEEIRLNDLLWQYKFYK